MCSQSLATASLFAPPAVSATLPDYRPLLSAYSGEDPLDAAIHSLRHPSEGLLDLSSASLQLSHNIPFKHNIVKAYFNGTALNTLSVEYDLCRHLIYTWIVKCENDEFDAEIEQPEQTPEYEARIAAIERLVGAKHSRSNFKKLLGGSDPPRTKKIHPSLQDRRPLN